MDGIGIAAMKTDSNPGHFGNATARRLPWRADWPERLLLAGFAGCFLLALGGCAVEAPLAPTDTGIYDDRAFAPPATPIHPEDVFALSDAMRRYLTEQISGQLRLEGRKQGLIDALYTKGQLRLEYDAAMTRNASEAFSARSGNCLSLVIMSAAFARELRIPVRYQLVLADDTWSRNRDLYVAIGHVNLVLGSVRSRAVYGVDDEALTTVDFLPEPDSAHTRVRAVSQDTVVAMYMNNRAVESLADGQVDAAYWWARASIQADPRFLNAYNTLGAIYARHGNWDKARRVLEAALERDPSNPDAMANLIPVLNALGETNRATALAAQLKSIEPNPPFADFNRGLTALQLGQLAAAREFFTREVAREPWYHEFHYWLGVTYVRLGDLPRARDELELAMQDSTTRRDFDLYSAKLERISSYLKR